MESDPQSVRMPGETFRSSIGLSPLYDLAVAGGGVMGLGCALEDARRGKRVLVFDPMPSAQKASWAAAGILVTRDAHAFSSPFREFYVRSIQAYPAWLDTIATLSGTAVPLHRGGDYQIYDLDDAKACEQLEAKTRQMERERSRDYTVTSTLPKFLETASPLRNVKVFHFPNEAYVQNRDLLAALQAACIKAGVQFLTGVPIGPWVHRSGKTLLKFQQGTIEAEKILIAAGAWSGRILEAMGIAAPMLPVKGQMMRIPKFYPADCMVHFNEDLYLVPRGDTLIAGATTEPGVWEEGFDEKGDAYLSNALNRFVPAIARNAMETWSGLRPRSRDRLPWMGWVDKDKGWAICSGHYKCGISMAPMAALCMSRLMNGEKPPIDLDPFQPWRPKGLQGPGHG